ncbi:MAG: hypothetical protein DCC75_10820 [Proteobacteria bacterium]|nr:MAG: hypothetical protein DCC75_10820 [Pseudomonadota bacterium]
MHTSHQSDSHPMQHEHAPDRSLEQVLGDRRDRLTKALNFSNEILVVFSGEPHRKPGGVDQEYRFITHPSYQWLTASAGPSHALVFDPREGWIDFRRQPTEDDFIWAGAVPDGRGRPIEELFKWLQERAERPVKFVGGSFDSSLRDLFSPYAPVQDPDVEQIVLHQRRAKDSYALARIQAAVEITAKGFAEMARYIQPWVSERDIRIQLEHVFFRSGADDVSFPTIVGAGTSSAALHYFPTSRQVERGDWVLVDAGAELGGYVADVTRMFPASGEFNTEQREIYEAVRRVQEAAISRCQPRMEWSDLHLLTALDLAAELKEMGVLKVGPEEAVNGGAIALFLPHGVGHMVGLGVRDASGWSPDREELVTVAGAKPRCNFKLEPGFTMTVEPGCYFIEPLLLRRQLEGRHLMEINYDKALDFARRIGGVRIEDDIVVTEGAPKVLTAGIPK